MSFFSLTVCTWVLSLTKNTGYGYAGFEHYEYRCDALNDLIASIGAHNPEGREPTPDWEVTLFNTKEKKDYSSVLKIPELYPISYRTYDLIEESIGLNLKNEQYPMRLRYIWDKESCEILVDHKKGKLTRMGRPAPPSASYDLIDLFEEVYGYSPHKI